MENQIINGRYRILQQIGIGGFGQTYLAEDLHLPTRPRVVVKHLKPQANDEETASLANRLFQQEAEILYHLGNHPFIPQLLAHFPENGEFFLVQECIEGLTIAQEFSGGRRYTEKEIIQLLGQTLEILSFVHGQKVIHRDIKPANLIRRQSDGNIFLIDFGAVKQVNAFPQNYSSSTFSTFSTLTIGSHGYMPMEQLAGKPNYSSDLYALGLVAIEAVTGIKPTDLKQNQNTGEYIWAHKAALSPEIEHFISKLVRFDYRQRYNSAIEAVASLNMVAKKIGFFTNKTQAPMLSQNDGNPAFPVSSPPIQSRPTNIKPANNILNQQNGDSNIPPTLIVPMKEQNGFVGSQITLQPVNSARREEFYKTNRPQNSFSEKPSAYKYGIIVFACLLFLGGLVYSANSLVKGFQPQTSSENYSKNDENGKKSAKETVSSLPPENSYSLFDEAEKQAAEAELLETKATTKFEWSEVGSKYKRAYALLASIENTSSDYSKAREKMNYYKQKAESAFQKISTALESPTMNINSSAPSNVTSPVETVSQNSNQNAIPATLKISMPPKQSHKTYLSYNFTNGNNIEKKVITTDDALFTSSVEKHSENKRDSGVVRIRIEGGSYSSAALELKPIYGQSLTAGNYPGAQEYLWQSPTRYAVAFDKLHCFEKGNHSFTINSIVYDELYSNISLLDATFTINCDNRRLMGRIRYDGRF